MSCYNRAPDTIQDRLATFSADLKYILTMIRSMSSRRSIQSEPAATRKLTVDHILRTAAQSLARSFPQSLGNRRSGPAPYNALGEEGDQNIRIFESERLIFWKSRIEILKRSESKRPKI